MHSLDSIINTSFSISYGITDDMSLSARLPYAQQNNIQEGEIEDGTPEAHTHGDSSGLSDILAMGQYRLLEHDDTNISMNFGVKAPTGSTDIDDKDKIKFESEFQSGSGSWDFLIGFALSKNTNKFGYHANVIYNKTTEGSDSTDVGDSFSYNIALTYRINRKEEPAHDHGSHKHDVHSDHVDITSPDLKWDLIFELNGVTLGKNTILGVSEEYSGGTIFMLSPGVRATFNGFGGFISFGYPVIQNANGKQADIEKRIVAGISFGI